MSYRCSFCNDKVPHGIPLRRFTTYRVNRQIASEQPICAECAEMAGEGKILRVSLPAPTIQAQRFDPAPYYVETVKPQPVAVQTPKPSPVKGKQGAVGIGLAATLNLKNGKIEPKPETKTKKGK